MAHVFNKSIEQELILNYKPESSVITSELMIHNRNKIRQIRDQSTDSFVFNLFSYNYQDPANNIEKTKKRNLFLMFVYDYFNLTILSQFDIYLMQNNVELLNIEKEFIKFQFKGGNTYFHIINDLLSTFHDGLSDNNRTSFNNFLGTTFKVSDFDFTLNIKCITFDKFIKIKYYLTKFIIIKLEEITLFFNQYLLNVLNPDNIITSETVNNSKIFKLSNNDLPPLVPLQLDHDIQLNTMNNALNNSRRKKLNKLKLISTLFSEVINNLFFDKFIVAVKNNLDPRFSLNIILSGPFTFALLDYYAKIVSDFESFKIRSFLHEIIINIRLINKLLGMLHLEPNPISNNKIYNATIINIFSNLDFVNNKYLLTIFTFNFNLDLYKNIQETYFDNLRKYFIKIKFYTEKVFIDIIINLRDKLEEISTDEDNNIKIFVDDPKNKFLFKFNYDFYDESNYKVFKLRNNEQNNIELNNIKINTRNDLIYMVDNNSEKIYENKKTNNFHYITYNSSISSSNNGYLSIKNFDLLRSKFNFNLKNIFVKKFLRETDDYSITELSIPSEFIDISIPFYFDTNYYNLIENSSYSIEYVNFIIPDPNPIDNTFKIESFSLSYLIHDLVEMLFLQNIFIPWLDPKYEKRLRRLFFLYLIHNKNESIIKLIDISTIASNMIDYIQNPNPINLAFINNYSKYPDINDFIELCDNIIVHTKNIEKYRYAQDILYFSDMDELINSMFFCFQLYLSNATHPDEMLNIINYMRKRYKYSEYTMDEYIINYVNKIELFLVDIKDSSETVITLILSCYNNLPIYIP